MEKKDNLFIEFRFEDLEFRKEWKDFVDRWKLNIVTDSTTKRCTVHNDDYSICMTGHSLYSIVDECGDEGEERPEIDKPTGFVSLIMSDNILTKRMLSFLNDLTCSTYEVEDLDFFIHMNEIKDTIHPDWLIHKMTKCSFI